MNAFEHEVYITSVPSDEDFATRLMTELSKRGVSIQSRADMPIGANYRDALLSAASTCRLVIAVLSPAYLSSPLQTEERERVIERERVEGRVILLPAYIEACTLPADLADRVRVDFRLSEQDQSVFERGVEKLVKAIKPVTIKTQSPASSASFAQLPPEPTLPFPTPPADLVQSCANGDCVLFAGAGLSARAGVSTWSIFLSDLLDYAIKAEAIPSADVESLRAALQVGARDAVADGIVQMFIDRRVDLQVFLQGYFLEQKPIATAHWLLQQIPFSAVITTNYDRLLEQTFPEYAEQGLYTSMEADPLLDALAQKRHFLLKLYGVIERMDSLILAPIEYKEAFSSNVSFGKFMEGIFSSRTFFFVGLALDGIQDFLDGFVFRGKNPRRHFALVAVSGSAWQAKARFLLNRYNIEVIPFPVSNDFPEVDGFLEELVRKIEPAPASTAAQSIPSPPTQGIRGLLLEDIGPFESLKIDFARENNWKVLLGDNGVGKSTILKAIAVAIMGSDARSYAARLVRSGKTKGRITLYTEQNPSGYVTEIMTKDMLSEADVVSRPARPMESEGWLALGFSPLRVVTWASSSGPQAILQKGRPTSDDLLPLVSGELDPRMDRLKQWIVNLDSADKPGRTRILSGHTARIRSIVFSPDSRTLYSGSIDGSIRVWDCGNDRLIRQIQGHSGGVNSIALSVDGRYLVSGSYDHTAKSWMTNTFAHKADFTGSGTQITSVAINADSTKIVTSSESGSIRIWSSESGTLIHRIAGHTAVWCVALSPDGSKIAAGTYEGRVMLFATDTAKSLGAIEMARGSIMGVTWSPDGESVVIGSQNGPVHLLSLAELANAESGSSEHFKEFPSSDTWAVAISADGRSIAAGSKSGSVLIWDRESGQEIMHIQAHAQAVWSVAFAPDGRTLASGSEDGTVRLWNMPGSTPVGNQQETIRRFFRLVGELMDRPDIDYVTVTEDYRVMVKVADNPTGVPMELLSQGMTSLFGWVGVLCQRLKETLQVSSTDPLPVNSYALVLIDELDAHMHPRWQQVLIARLKKAFPNVQFVACTHSPLIAAGLSAGEVDRLSLVNGKIVKAQFDADMLLGRTDQILTGELFGLKSTLDPETQNEMKLYQELLSDPNRNLEEFRKVDERLSKRIPVSTSGLIERRAAELLDAVQDTEGYAHASSPADLLVREQVSKLMKALAGGR